MIRFLIRVKVADRCSGGEWTEHKTIDLDMPSLEQELRNGRMGQSDYRIPELIGVEILAQPPKDQVIRDVARWLREAETSHTVMGFSGTGHGKAAACLEALLPAPPAKEQGK